MNEQEGSGLSEDSSYYLKRNRHYRPSRPGRNTYPSGTRKRGWGKVSPATADRMRREHIAGRGAAIARGVPQPKPGEGSPGSIRALAKKYKVSARVIQAVIHRRGAYAVQPRPGESGPTSAEQAKQRAREQRERALAIQAVRDLLSIGARHEAEQLRLQFNIQPHEVRQ